MLTEKHRKTARRAKTARGSGVKITHSHKCARRGGAGHSLVDDDPVVFEVEFDAPLLGGYWLRG